nr:unnamed protein product [Callosobruchus chinensis]
MDHWMELTGDTRILGWVKGFKIPFIHKSDQNNVPQIQIWSPNDKEIMLAEIGKLLKSGAISLVRSCEGQYISKIFTIAKPDGSVRLSLNLKSFNLIENLCGFSLMAPSMNSIVSVFGLNGAPMMFTKIMKPVVSFLRGKDYKHCQTNILETVSILGYLGFIINYDESFLVFKKECIYLGFEYSSESFPLDVADRKFMRFFFDGSLYEFNCLCFWLKLCTYDVHQTYETSCPFLARKRAHVSKDYKQCQTNILETVSILEYLGFIINYDKSFLVPKEECIYLGFEYNSENMTILPAYRKA